MTSPKWSIPADTLARLSRERGAIVRGGHEFAPPPEPPPAAPADAQAPGSALNAALIAVLGQMTVALDAVTRRAELPAPSSAPPAPTPALPAADPAPAAPPRTALTSLSVEPGAEGLAAVVWAGASQYTIERGEDGDALSIALAGSGARWRIERDAQGFITGATLR